MVRKSNGRSITRPARGPAANTATARPASQRPAAPRRPAAASPRRARRRDSRRDEILKAAARIFRTRGVVDTGMRDIAEAADLSPANLYHYFRGKDEIVFYCQDRALDRMLAAVVDARRAAAAVPDRLHRVLAAHARILLDEVDGGVAHLDTSHLPAALRARMVVKRDRYEQAVRRLLKEGIGAGVFLPVDAAVVVRAMLGAVNWTATWFRADGARTADDIGHEIARVLVRGVTATSPPGDRRLQLASDPGPRSA